MKILCEGAGVKEKAYDALGKCSVAVDPRYFRPTEVETLLVDPTKAKEKLGWTPKISFDETPRWQTIRLSSRVKLM
jgi:GDPmannose 4,6-dehydratase